MESIPRIVFFGTTNELSLASFRELIDGGVIIVAAVVTADVAFLDLSASLERIHPVARTSELPLVNPFLEPNLIHAAWSAKVPVYALKNMNSPSLSELLSTLQPDAGCVACFPWKIPMSLISSLRFGFVNVHPSLLPFYRGPEPLFWLFREADLECRGVSVHRMDADLDTGPLLCQQSIEFPDGMGQIEVERACGALGGQLLIRALDKLTTGERGDPQPGNGSSHPWPMPADYALDTNWSARRAFNFMRATNGATAVYPVRDLDLTLAEALGFVEYGRQPTTVEVDGRFARIQFSQGILRAKTYPQ